MKYKILSPATLTFFLAALLAIIFPAMATADVLYMSCRYADTTFMGETYNQSAIIAYDTSTGDVSKYFEGDDVFLNKRKQINGLFIKKNSFLFSTMTVTHFQDTDGNMSFIMDEDIGEYDFDSNQVSIYENISGYYDGGNSFFDNIQKSDIDALTSLANGDILLSNDEDTTINDGTAIYESDILMLDAQTGEASVYLSGKALWGSDVNYDVDCLHVLANGNIVFGTDETDAEVNGINIGRGRFAHVRSSHGRFVHVPGCQ